MMAARLMTRRTWAGVAAAALACQLTIPSAQLSSDPPLELFVAATGADERVARAALATIAASWRDGFAASCVDVARVLPSPQALRMRDEHLAVEPDGAASIDIGRPDARSIDPLTRRGAGVRRRITAFLESQTGERFGDDLRAWRRWMWRLPYAPHDDYATFKGELYARLDPGFRRFFPARVRTAIRLDEIDWGGVRVNQIPPLRSPKTVPAESAAWLDDDHLVFGVEVNGEA